MHASLDDRFLIASEIVSRSRNSIVDAQIENLVCKFKQTLLLIATVANGIRGSLSVGEGLFWGIESQHS